MFKSWSLKAKTVTAFAVVSLSLLTVGVGGFYSLQRVGATYEKIPQIAVRGMIHANRLQSEAYSIRVTINRINLALKETPPNFSEAKKFAEAATQDVKEYIEADQQLQKVPTSVKEKELYDQMNAHWESTKKAVETLVLMGQSPQADGDLFASLMQVQYRAAADQQLENLATLTTMFEADSKAVSKEASEMMRVSNLVTLAIIAFGFFLAIATGLFFASSITKTLSRLNERLKKGAETVAGASHRIAASSSQLSASATEQASALQETVSSVDEVSAMINKNADNAKQSQDVSLLSQQSASKGRDAVNDLIHSIDEISRSNAEMMSQIDDSNRQMGEIVKVIAEIGNKTKVINDIVFQTKLLSFNASVEAARAGEHGKGFAVVAEEVGNLAQMSGNAAKEISQMLDDSSSRVEGIVDSTKSKIERLVAVGREKVQDGTERARECGSILEEIVLNVTQVTQLMSEIATASREQSQGVQEINRAMSQLDQVTQQNAVASQDSANASEDLSRQATEMRSIVDELTSTIVGQHDGKQDETHTKQTEARHSASAPVKNNTVSIKKHLNKTAPRKMDRQEVKKAAGGESFPSENDPRFEDI